MSGKKGMRQYPTDFRVKIVEEYKNGNSVKSLSKRYNVSRWAIQNWCGLVKEKEIFCIPKRRGRPPKTKKPEAHEMEMRIKALEREVELLRSFLHAAGRM